MINDSNIVVDITASDSLKKDILLFALQREDTLINNRLNWLLVLHGFLYGSLALMVGSKTVGEISEISIIFSILGVATGIATAYLSSSANSSIRDIREKWGKLETIPHCVSPFGKGGHGADSVTNKWGLSFFIPLCCSLAWLLILLVLAESKFGIIQRIF